MRCLGCETSGDKAKMGLKEVPQAGRLEQRGRAIRGRGQGAPAVAVSMPERVTNEVHSSQVQNRHSLELPNQKLVYVICGEQCTSLDLVTQFQPSVGKA